MKLLALLALVLSLCGCAPLPERRCLASPMSGTVIAHGHMVVGATVTRKYYSPWYNRHVETTTHTDGRGEFKFKGAWKFSLILFAHQPVIQQEVIVTNEGRAQVVLKLTKMDYDRFGELWALEHPGGSVVRGRLSTKDGQLFLSCDLDAEPTGTAEAKGKPAQTP